MATQYTVTNKIATIEILNPPVNTLDHPTRTAIAASVSRALADPGVDTIILTGSAGTFSAGAEITEFGTPQITATPSLYDLIAMLESATKPVIVAVDGTCCGGGLELVLGAHYRVATAASRIGLPEVALGLVPGAGGTQRLPRVLDVGIAAEMITDGVLRTAGHIAELDGQQLFNRVVDTDVLSAATQLAVEIAGVRPLPRIRDLATPSTGRTAIGALRTRLQQRSRGLLAPLAALDLVDKATTVPIDSGLEAERATFDTLVAGPQSAALKHAFFAERAARKIPQISSYTAPRTVDTVVVIGAGTMGAGIATTFLNAGLPVRLLETNQEALDRGIGTIRRNLETQVAKGKLTSAAFEQRMSLLTPTLNYEDIAIADLVVEAVFEDIDVKRTVFTRLDGVMKRGAILATNTSTLDVDDIAALTGRPQDVLGMHFFSPAHVMRLLEVVRGEKTLDEVLITAMAVGQRVGKTTVVSGVCDGFIGNRMVAKYQDAARVLLEAGATPLQIDSAIESFGLAMGPFRMADLAGNDISWAIRKRRYAEQPDSPHDEIADALCELGRYGQKTQAGWYDYAPGSRDALHSTTVTALLASFHEKRGSQVQSFAPEEIVERLIFALIDEGARILDEGIALRASDIDVVYLAGYGFPRHRGGPMYYADSVGLDTVVRSLQQFAAPGWEPAPLLTRLAADGKTFQQWDRENEPDTVSTR